MRPVRKPPIINMAIVGGSALCAEVLEKTTFDYQQEGVTAPILAVADPDNDSPGMRLARRLGLLTFTDFEKLYDPRYNIHMIIVLTPDPEAYDRIRASRPDRIRIMSSQIFEIFWKAIGLEERKLREEKKAIETIVNGIQEFILVITPDLKIIEANEAFLTKLGYTREEVIGRKCNAIFQCVGHTPGHSDPFCPMNEVIRNQVPTHQIRTRKGRNGAPRYFEVNIYPIWEKGGKISKFIHISRDITQRKKEEEEITRRLEQMVEERTRQLKETHDKLLHQDKMASLGKLAASVVHEINNPIAGALNLIMLIKRILGEGKIQQRDVDEFGRYLNLMETETRRISRIVSNLLAFSRQSKIELKKLNVNRLIDQTLLINANLLKINHVAVKKELGEDIPALVGSEDQLQQVFMNLISNAAEAMENTLGGELRITTAHRLKKNLVEIRFSDTGPGIPKDNLVKLFEPFFTTKKKGKGVGLGLSVVYGIIQEHHGSIFVDSEEGQGASFIIKLPLEPQRGP